MKIIHFSPMTFQKLDMAGVLGGITGNASHNYVKASATKLSYYLKKNEVLNKKEKKFEDPIGKQWELEFEKVIRGNYSERELKFSTETR